MEAARKQREEALEHQRKVAAEAAEVARQRAELEL